MSDVKFVDELPPGRNPGGDGKKSELLAALRAHPGQWAEVARYPKARQQTGRTYAQNTKRNHPDIEATTRLVGDELIVFMRAVAR